ncbi:histidine kinase [Siphonobacter sp. BAB-5385]|uniref:sensor histidine kinase n=1 Tax=Siphonobacter sp. BAB-5385 TaxID=1864822 RepID=UPI000B9ECB19|nr:sensor histidine kinase [Siphonobacter sp. BAB-5385]OZI09667.1 histidine kinase [Siphonobacter sp. BAB-5385]
MAKQNSEYSTQLDLLTDYLFANRETILNAWRMRCASDPASPKHTNFSREEFNDQIPSLLNYLSQRIKGEKKNNNVLEFSEEHGLHRWQSGYSLSELSRELSHLYEVIQERFQAFLDLYPDTQAQVMTHAHRQLLELAKDLNLGSILYFDQLRQTAAAEQVRTLENALKNLEEITKQRGEHLRQVSHDLRGNLGLMSGATASLQLPKKESDRQKFLEMLAKNIRAAEDMLTQLMNYARLEAGQEVIENQPFDASELLQKIIKRFEGLAKTKKLKLNVDGPPKLLVVGDPMKIERIIQNLLLNALKYTEKGWVNVTWIQETDSRWQVSVQDTGPGLKEGVVSLLAQQLQPYVHSTSSHRQVEILDPEVPATRLSNKQSSENSGEGIGLFIVKRLCELLKANMEIETSEKGTLIRIRLLINQKQESHS